MTVPLQRPPHNFLVNMKLEAVDRRNPALIRVASVEDVEDHRIKVAPGPLGWGSGQVSWAGVCGLARGQGHGLRQEDEDAGSRFCLMSVFLLWARASRFSLSYSVLFCQMDLIILVLRTDGARLGAGHVMGEALGKLGPRPDMVGLALGPSSLGPCFHGPQGWGGPHG